MKNLYIRFVLLLIGPAIRAELVRQKRPGGLLFTEREAWSRDR